MSQQDKEIIYYEHLHCKVHWKYTTSFQYDFEIVRLEDILREENYCYGVDQYIKRFIDVLKERVIKYLPELKKVDVIFDTMDKNNLLHRVVISVTETIIKMLNLKARKIDYYKSIIIIIKYEGKNVFMGHINFDGLL
jgi:hypothetical protein